MRHAALSREIIFLIVLATALICSPLARAVDANAVLSTRPSMAAACSAWREHIHYLIEQHRLARDIEESALFEFVLQFIAARDNCTSGKFEVGLRMYEAIALGRPQGPLK